MDPLVKFGSPSEYCRGTPPERFFTEVRPAGSRRRLGHYTSPGVPRPYGVLVPGAPFCHDRARAGRGRRGIPLPRRCRPRVFSTPRRFQPRRRTWTRVAPDPRFTSSLRPERSRPCFMPQTPLGFSLQSFPLSESRAAFRRPVLPCEFGLDRW